MSELVPNALHAELRALIASSRHRLAQEFGRGFKAKNLRRMVQSTQAFPLPGIVATLSRQLNWSKSCTQRCLKRASEQKPLAQLQQEVFDLIDDGRFKVRLGKPGLL
jgi:hypothetical protein